MAANMTIEEMRQHIGADSLAFISVEGLKSVSDSEMLSAMPVSTGDYPVELSDLDYAAEHDRAAEKRQFIGEYD